MILRWLILLIIGSQQQAVLWGEWFGEGAHTKNALPATGRA